MAIHRKDKMCDIFDKRKEPQEEIYLPIPFIMHQRSQMLAKKGSLIYISLSCKNAWLGRRYQ